MFSVFLNKYLLVALAQILVFYGSISSQWIHSTKKISHLKKHSLVAALPTNIALLNQGNAHSNPGSYSNSDPTSASNSNPSPSYNPDPNSNSLSQPPSPADLEKMQEEMQVQVEMLQKFQTTLKRALGPYYDKSMALMKDPVFHEYINTIIESDMWGQFLIGQLLIILFMLLFRSWRLSKTTHWFHQLWIGIWSFAIFLGLSIVALPYLLWGSTFKNLCLVVFHYY